MDRLKAEDVLRPGAKLVTGLVDMNDPEIRKAFEETRKRISAIKEQQGAPFENLLITI